MIRMQEILELTVAERISMIGEIWDSIDPDTIEVPASHQQELDRRLNRYENGETIFFSWNEIKSELNSNKK